MQINLHSFSSSFVLALSLASLLISLSLESEDQKMQRSDRFDSKRRERWWQSILPVSDLKKGDTFQSKWLMGVISTTATSTAATTTLGSGDFNVECVFLLDESSDEKTKPEHGSLIIVKEFAFTDDLLVIQSFHLLLKDVLPRPRLSPLIRLPSSHSHGQLSSSLDTSWGTIRDFQDNPLSVFRVFCTIHSVFSLSLSFVSSISSFPFINASNNRMIIKTERDLQQKGQNDDENECRRRNSKVCDDFRRS